MRIVLTFSAPDAVGHFSRSIESETGFKPFNPDMLQTMTAVRCDDWEQFTRSVHELPTLERPMVSMRGFGIRGNHLYVTAYSLSDQGLQASFEQMGIDSFLEGGKELQIVLGSIPEHVDHDKINRAARGRLEFLRASPFRMTGLALWERYLDWTLAPLTSKNAA